MLLCGCKGINISRYEQILKQNNDNFCTFLGFVCKEQSQIMKKIAIFASGEGTNAENIIRYFQKKRSAEIVMVVTNKQHAGVCERTRKLGIETIFAPAADFRNGRVLQLLQENHVDYIILAGFLLMVSEDILDHFPNKIINIHPALLPKHGGKGMYGRRVHEDVIANGDDVSGITIHYINKEYDKGKTIFQAKCPVLPGDTSDTLAARVHELEYAFFPKVIEDVILSTN